MNVEHLWFSTKSTEKNMHNAPSLDMTQSDLPEENMIQTLTNMADKRLFKLVKWCKSLPLFKNILVNTIWTFFSVSLHAYLPKSWYFLNFADRRSNFSSHQCLVRAFSIFVLLPLNWHSGKS